MRGRFATLVAFGLGALAASILALWLRSEPAPPQSAAQQAEIPPDAAVPRTAEEWAKLVAPQQALESAPEAPAEAGPPPAIPSHAQIRVQAKLVPKPLSSVSHEVVGAWDEAPDSPDPGKHRAFVVIVKPGISDAELENLARDVRDQNREAEVLDVRIFDDKAASLQGHLADGGQAAFTHQIGSINRNDRIGIDVIRLRGKIVSP